MKGVLPTAWPCPGPPVPPPTATGPGQGEPRLPTSPTHCRCPTHPGPTHPNTPPLACPAHPNSAPSLRPAPRAMPRPVCQPHPGVQAPPPHHFCVSGTWTCGASWGSATRGGCWGCPVSPRAPHPSLRPSPLTLSDFLFFAVGRDTEGTDLTFSRGFSPKPRAAASPGPGPAHTAALPTHTHPGPRFRMCPPPLRTPGTPPHLSSQSHRTSRCH